MIRLSRALAARRDRRDKGAVLILFALILFSLLAVTAIVVDLGLARATRRTAQANADLAAVAAGFSLAGGGSWSLSSDPRAACNGAIASLQANYEDLPSPVIMSPSCNSLPTSVSACTASSNFDLVSTSSSDPYRITIEWPVEDSEIARDEFNGTLGGTAQAGVGSMDGSRCQRMRITVERQNDALFAGILGRGGENIQASATVKAFEDGEALAIPALLLLERRGCRTLEVSGTGAVKVEDNGDVYGVIHSDTEARVNDPLGVVECSGNSGNANGWGIYGTPRPASVGGGPSIIAESTALMPGRISVYALQPSINNMGAAVWEGDGDPDNGLNVQPSAGRIISRMPVDKRFNDPNDTSKQFIRNTHVNGWALAAVKNLPSNTNDPAVILTRLQSNAAYWNLNFCRALDSQCWKVISGAQCNQSNVVYQGRDQGPAVGQGADNYFVLCDEFSGSNVVFRNGLWNSAWGTKPSRYGRVVFAGKVSTAGNACSTITTNYGRCNGYLAIPNADEIVIRGCVSSCNGAGGYAIRSSGLFAVNQGEDLNIPGLGFITNPTSLNGGIAPADWPWLNCTALRNGPGGGGLYTQWTRIATFNLDFEVSNGTASMCQTTMYMGYPSSTYTPQWVASGGNCTADLPCPTNTPATGAGRIEINSGSNLPVAWQAPNLTSDKADSINPTEDLALWMEGGGSSLGCTIGGQGAMKAGGIFFHPNCRLSYDGQTDNTNPLNAQFIGRSLEVSGQGVLSLKPSANDSIAVRVGGAVTLIR